MPVKVLERKDEMQNSRFYLFTGCHAPWKCLLKPKRVSFFISNDNVIFPKTGNGFD